MCLRRLSHDPVRCAVLWAGVKASRRRDQGLRHAAQRRTREHEGVEPRPQADPERYGEKENWRPHLGPPSGSDQLHRLRPAARREPHLAEPLEQRHVQLGLFLIAVESQLDQHFALWRRYVARREAIEREYEDVAAARVATAEPG